MRKDLTRINYFCFAIGMIGVWIVTESWWAMFWAFIASVHLQYTTRIKKQDTPSEG